MKQPTQTYHVKAEITYSCPFCGSMYHKKGDMYRHLNLCWELDNRGLKRSDIKLKFLKPR